MSTKITKAQAVRRYKAGQPIYIQASKLRPVHAWGSALELTKPPHIIEGKTLEGKELLEHLENILNHFRYYNCSKETGLRVSFYADIY